MSQAPYRAVINIKCEIMERLPSGHVTGIPKKRISKVHVIDGDSLEDCAKQTKAFLSKLEN